MTTLNTIIEEEKKKFDEEIERLEEIFFDEDGYDKVKLYLKSEKNTLFASTIYPETFYELDQEKVKNFLTTAMQRAYEAGRKDWLRSEIEKLESEKDYEAYDEMCCGKCGDFVRERFSHNSEDGFSQCCGKKLVREQGKRDTYSEKNQALTSIITRYKEELKVLEGK